MILADKKKILYVHSSSHNQKERQNYLKYYDEESIKIINKVFARDFEAFDYKPISNLSQFLARENT